MKTKPHKTVRGRTPRLSTRLGRWWPLWSILGGVVIAGFTVVVMRYVG